MFLKAEDSVWLRQQTDGESAGREIVPPILVGELAARRLWANLECDLKVLKRSAGGVATRRRALVLQCVPKAPA